MSGERTTPVVRWVTRAGLAANGVLHLLVAWLAVRVALGDRTRADQSGALQTVAGQPFGRELVWLVTGGFAAVVLWRVREAGWGFRYVRDGRERAVKRLFSVGQAAVYAVLAVLASRVALGDPAGGAGEELTADLLRRPGGRQVVVVAGAVILVVGAAVVVQGLRKRFTEDMDLERAGRPMRTVAVRAGQIGSAAKGLAFMIIGALVASAALSYRPERAEGLDAALKTLAAQPYGSAGLLVVAAGVASFGAFLFFDARFHRVQ